MTTTTTATRSETNNKESKTTTSAAATTTVIVCSEQSSPRYPNRFRRTRPKKRRLHHLPFDNNDDDEEEEESEKGQKERKKRKEEDDGDGDVTYEINPNEILSSCEGVRVYQRPLPSMTTMAALASASQRPKQQQQQEEEEEDRMEEKKESSAIPILHSFLKAIGRNKTRSDAAAGSMQTLTENEQWKVDINNSQDQTLQPPTTPSSSLSSFFTDNVHTSSSSSISKGQHCRFKYLLLNKQVHLASSYSATALDPLIKRRIKEYKSLEKLIKEEQVRYCTSLMEFRDEKVCLDRFLIGFKVPGPASKFVNVNSKLISFYKNRWKKNTKHQLVVQKNEEKFKHHHHHQPTKYEAKYSQSISLSKLCAPFSETEFHPPYIACQRNTTAATTADGRSCSSGSFDLDSYSSCIVKTISGTNVAKTNLEFLQSSSSSDNISTTKRLKPPVGIPLKTNKDIMNDYIAKSLAIKHDVNVVLTSETFETLLKRPGYDSTRWMIPLTIEMKKNVLNGDINENRQQRAAAAAAAAAAATDAGGGSVKSIKKTIAFMEEPIPQPSTPRECLTRGFQQSLVERFGNLSSSYSSSTKIKEDDQNQEDCLQYVYTLLTLPSSSKKSHQRHSTATASTPFRVLVRSTNTLLVDDNGDDTNKNNDNNKHQSSLSSSSAAATTASPVHIRAQLEYFHQDRKGTLEEYTQHDRTIWIMDKLLQPTCRTITGRVDPTTATLLKWEEKSIVDALTGVTNKASTTTATSTMLSSSLYGASFNPNAHFQAMEEVVRATEKIGVGQYLLCYPGRGIPSSTASSSSLLPMAMSTVKTAVSLHKAYHYDGDDDDDDDIGNIVANNNNNKEEAASGVSSTKKSKNVIDIGNELLEAEAVYMGHQSLRLCFRPWVWDSEDERVPFTFRMKVDE